VLEKRIEDVNMLNRVRFTLVTEGDEKKLTEVFAITVYRVINELVNNILKHSLASEAAIQLLIEDAGIQIMAEDDGIGFNRELTGNGIGLKNIKGRVEFLKGEMHIDSNNNGTQTVIHIPL
jgi:signal transduction histidine kinase